MSETFNRQQVDDITAPWLNLCKEQEERIDQLEAARLAYASEFDGDVGSIHENIRKLKAENAKLREALLPFAHPDLRERHPGATRFDSVIWARDSAELILADFDRAAELLEVSDG